MPDKIQEELISLLNKLRVSTFTGRGISKWYPEGSQAAYYRMEYSPGKIVVRHKSPWSPIEERLEAKYSNANLYDDFTSVEICIGADLYREYSEEDLKSLDDSKALELTNKCNFKDPRWMLEAAETWQEIAVDGLNKRAYLIKVLDFSPLDPDSGLRVLAELFVENGVLKMMRVRKFLGKKEIFSQNMDIVFQFQ